MALLMGFILAVPALLNAHQHLSHKCLIRAFCNGTQIHSICLPVTQEEWPKRPIRTPSLFEDLSTLINTVISVIFPIILLIVLNVLLLCALRRRQRELAIIGTTKQIKYN
ncbi:hypothetical protein niasHT_027233 [Heterodera trifolii]|uniref:Uncharacterized protein n=1 Tax=Heterodera trifolii TaxID=157864 RepID=A0ABD2JGH9_9BILA